MAPEIATRRERTFMRVSLSPLTVEWLKRWRRFSLAFEAVLSQLRAERAAAGTNGICAPRYSSPLWRSQRRPASQSRNPDRSRPTSALLSPFDGLQRFL